MFKFNFGELYEHYGFQPSLVDNQRSHNAKVRQTRRENRHLARWKQEWDKVENYFGAGVVERVMHNVQEKMIQAMLKDAVFIHTLCSSTGFKGDLGADFKSIEISNQLRKRLRARKNFRISSTRPKPKIKPTLICYRENTELKLNLNEYFENRNSMTSKASQRLFTKQRKRTAGAARNRMGDAMTRKSTTMTNFFKNRNKTSYGASRLSKGGSEFQPDFSKETFLAMSRLGNDNEYSSNQQGGLGKHSFIQFSLNFIFRSRRVQHHLRKP